MRDVKLVRLSEDGTHLVLAHEGTGEEFALRIDDRIRGAVVSDRARIGQLPVERPSRLRPKEIQARLRAGESSEEIAEAAGVPLERILRYAGPVLAERQYIAEQARRCVLRRQAGEAAGRTLDQVVAARLESYGLDPERALWDAWRAPDGRWVVAVTYQRDGEEQRATFSYDPAGRLVVPADDAGRAIVEGPRHEPQEEQRGPSTVHGPAPRTPRDGGRLRLAPLPSPQAAPEVFAVDPDTGTREAEVRPLRPAPAPGAPGRPTSPPPRPAARRFEEREPDPLDSEETVDLSRTLGSHPGALSPVNRGSHPVHPDVEPVEPPRDPVPRLRTADPHRPQERAPEVLPDPAPPPSAEREVDRRPPAPESRAGSLRQVTPAQQTDDRAADGYVAPENREPVGTGPDRRGPEPQVPEREPAARAVEPERATDPERSTDEVTPAASERPEPGAERPTVESAPAAKAAPSAPAPETEADRGTKADESRAAEAQAEPAAQTEPEEPAPPRRSVRRPKPADAQAQRKRASRSARRGSVPSWDDILFGGKK